MIAPERIDLIADEVAIRWSNGEESYVKMDFLRSHSPSAENQGEKDLTGGVILAPEVGRDFRGVRVTSWSAMGSYALQFQFSDGHNTGLYSFDYLRELGASEDQALPDPGKPAPESNADGSCGTGCGCS